MASVSALVLIYDIRGFTAASRRMGVADLGAFMTGAHRAILEPFADAPPTFVKNLGDGHLLLWETPPEGAADLAAKVVAASARARAAFAAFVAGREAVGARLPRAVGIGVALGEVNRQDDYYGVALNLAARLQNLARPEGLALDRTVFEAVARRDDALRAAFRRARVRLKGLGATTVWVQRPFSWRRVLGRAARAAAVVALPLGYAALADAGLGVPGGDAVRAFLDGHEASVLRPVAPAAEVARGAAGLRRDLAALLLAARTPQGWVRADLSGASDETIDVWSSSQAIAALLAAPEPAPEDLRALLGGIDAAFERPHRVERSGVPVGWPAHPGYAYVEIEPALWTVTAIARALARPGLVPEADRGPWLERLSWAQACAERHRPGPDGGWNIFPDQKDPESHSPYSTALALLALLETRAAGLPWAGSAERRDALLAATAAWLGEQFVAQGALPGWRRTHLALDAVSPGLTLQAFALLLRAEAEAGLAMPQAVLAEIPARLASLEGVTMEQPPDAGEFMHFVVGEDGAERAQSESINFLWHPWAVEAGARWLDRARRHGAPTLEVVRVRRALAHLVLGLGTEAVREARGTWAFVASETLMGLSAVR